MEGKKVSVRLGALLKNVLNLRSIDIRMKMIMAHNVYQAITSSNEIPDITSSLLSIDPSIFSKLIKVGKEAKCLTTKRYLNEKAVCDNTLCISMKYMDAREILIENYLEKHKIPNKESLLKDFQEISVTCDEKNLKLLLKSRGFIWSRLPGTKKSIIMEDPKRVIERHRYFKQLQRFRDEGITIVYIEENNYAIQRGIFLDQEPAVLNTTKWYLIIATEVALLKTFTYNYVTSCDYRSGFNDMILSVIPKNSVVVVEEKLNWENDVLSDIPKDTNSKKVIKHWLDKHNIPYDDSMNKAELISLVNKFTNEGGRILDHYLKSLGHEVLRRQKGFPNLCLTAPIIRYIKNNYRDKRHLEYMTVGVELTEIIKSCTEDQWKEMGNRLRAEEKRVYEEDLMLDEVIDKLVSLVADTGINNLALDDYEHDAQHYIMDYEHFDISKPDVLLRR